VETSFATSRSNRLGLLLPTEKWPERALRYLPLGIPLQLTTTNARRRPCLCSRPETKAAQMPHLKYNTDAGKHLADYVSEEVFRLRCHTAYLVGGAREAITQSRALIARVDAGLAMEAPPGWLWPAY
jgi:hypothetical protein